MKKRVKMLVLRALRALGIFHLARLLSGDRVRILCYHGLWLGDRRFGGDGLFMLPETFRRRLKLLRDRGYPVISLDDAVDGIRGRRRLPRAAVAITIDDGWYGVYAEMLPALAEHQYPATLHVDTANLLSGRPVPHVLKRYVEKIGCDEAYAVATRTFEYMSPADLRVAVSQGLTIELHTHTHTMGNFSPDLLRREIERNRSVLAAVLGRPGASFRHLAYPSGRFNRSAFPCLRELGVVSATTVNRAMACPGSEPLALPRFLDSEKITDLEFEAELSGVLDFLRGIASMVERLVRRIHVPRRASKKVRRPGRPARTAQGVEGAAEVPSFGGTSDERNERLQEGS